jgi:hypothetical protein
MATPFTGVNLARRHAVQAGDWVRPMTAIGAPYCKVLEVALGIVRTECGCRWSVESTQLYRSGDVGDRCPCCEHVAKHGGGTSTRVRVPQVSP